MNAEASLQEKFLHLFAGRTDVFGTDTGGCVRIVKHPHLFGFWSGITNDHLHKPDNAIGIYPVRPDNTVRWGCVDIDTGNKPGALYETWEDAWQHSLLLTRVLAELGIHGWIERTRSRGAHVWVFATEPMPARTMRRALLAAHQIVGLPQKEVNPKQETLAEGKVGNYVRLPYPHGAINQYVIEPDGDMPEALTWEEFTVQAFEDRSVPLIFEQAAELYQEPPVVASTPSKPFDGRKIRDRSAYAEALITRGPLHQDRSSYLWLVARTLQEADVPFSDAWEALAEADRRWGKFHAKGQVEHLYRMLEKAYT